MNTPKLIGILLMIASINPVGFSQSTSRLPDKIDWNSVQSYRFYWDPDSSQTLSYSLITDEQDTLNYLNRNGNQVVDQFSIKEGFRLTQYSEFHQLFEQYWAYGDRHRKEESNGTLTNSINWRKVEYFSPGKYTCKTEDIVNNWEESVELDTLNGLFINRSIQKKGLETFGETYSHTKGGGEFYLYRNEARSCRYQQSFLQGNLESLNFFELHEGACDSLDAEYYERAVNLHPKYGLNSNRKGRTSLRFYPTDTMIFYDLPNRTYERRMANDTLINQFRQDEHCNEHWQYHLNGELLVHEKGTYRADSLYQTNQIYYKQPKYHHSKTLKDSQMGRALLTEIRDTSGQVVLRNKNIFGKDGELKKTKSYSRDRRPKRITSNYKNGPIFDLSWPVKRRRNRKELYNCGYNKALSRQIEYRKDNDPYWEDQTLKLTNRDGQEIKDTFPELVMLQQYIFAGVSVKEFPPDTAWVNDDGSVVLIESESVPVYEKQVEFYTFPEWQYRFKKYLQKELRKSGPVTDDREITVNIKTDRRGVIREVNWDDWLPDNYRLKRLVLNHFPVHGGARYSLNVDTEQRQEYIPRTQLKSITWTLRATWP